MNQTAFLFLFFLYLSTSTGTIPQYENIHDHNGGHSSEFKPMGYEWKMGDLDYGTALLEKIYALSKRNVEEKVEFDAEFYKFYNALPDVLKAFEVDLERVLRSNNLTGVVTGRIKSLSSLSEKMKKEGISDYRQITDIVGLRVTLQTLNDILKFKSAYLNEFNDSVGDIRCYGVCGPAVGSSDPRAKIYWPWRGSGYRRLHFKVAIPELDTFGEIQIGTPYMTLWADWEHDVVYKGPEGLQQNSEVKEYAQRLAKYYMMLDDIRNGMSPQCPQLLQDRNTCNFWNDLRTNMS